MYGELQHFILQSTRTGIYVLLLSIIPVHTVDSFVTPHNESTYYYYFLLTKFSQNDSQNRPLLQNVHSFACVTLMQCLKTKSFTEIIGKKTKLVNTENPWYIYTPADMVWDRQRQIIAFLVNSQWNGLLSVALWLVNRQRKTSRSFRQLFANITVITVIPEKPKNNPQVPGSVFFMIWINTCKIIYLNIWLSLPLDSCLLCKD